MAVTVFPISNQYFPLRSDLEIDGIINSFGDAYEQRINTGVPRGPRADGEGALTTYIGVNTFVIVMRNTRYITQPHATNANIDNSVRKLWDFYKARFYNATTDVPQWESFYVYNLDENDDLTTWTGDTSASGTNSRSEVVTHETGRYLVRFENKLSRERFVRSLYNFQITLREVAS